jgi:protein-disulfide isomerase-like protein with CxxC motif
MPSVQKAHNEYSKGRDVVVMSVSLDGGSDADVKKFLDAHKYTRPTARDQGMTVARRMEVRGVPTTVIIDRAGNIAARGFGPLDLDRPDVRKTIQTLVARK